jgi:hypothetical protein
MAKIIQNKININELVSKPLKGSHAIEMIKCLLTWKISEKIPQF